MENQMKKHAIIIACALISLVIFTSCAEGERGDSALKALTSIKGKPVINIVTSMGNIKIELWNDIAPKTVANFTALAFGGKEWTDPKTGLKEKKPFYDGLTFHRIIDNFMIQGGCPLGNGTGGPGYTFEDEIYDMLDAKKITGKIPDTETAEQVFEEIIIPYLKRTPNPDKQIISLLMECQKVQNPAPFMKNPVEFYMRKTGTTAPLMSRGKLKARVEYGTLCMANSGRNTNGSQFFIVTKKEGCPWLNGKHTVFGKVIEGMDVAEKIQKVKKGPGDRPEKPVTIETITLITGN
jgi:cyclophilin family peptidyl-prolyl cis-trans isomerase